MRSLFIASVLVTMFSTSAFAGQTGTGATNTYTNSHGTVKRVSTGSASGAEYLNGVTKSITLKQECAAQPGSRCQYSGAIINGQYAGYQQGSANTDPVSITTVAEQTVHFGKEVEFENSFKEVYKGTTNSSSHTAESWGSF